MPTLDKLRSNLSTLGQFDAWVAKHFPQSLWTGLLHEHVAARQHAVLWSAWLDAQGFRSMPYPGTPKDSIGATCKRCGAKVNRADDDCPSCGVAFPPEASP